MKRLVLFSFFDNDGIVDEYIYYLLKELQTIASELIIIVNGDIKALEKERMKKFAGRIIQRQNKGFDAGAYKDAIFNHIGVEQIKEYDELILCNDTFFGPFDSFKTIWEWSKDKKCDFWGLHLWKTGYLEYISSFFLVLRKTILLNDNFYEYWEQNINENCTDIKEVYATFEAGLFYELCEMGYTYDVYAQVGNYHIIMSPDYAIEKYNAPFMKKKVFLSKYYHFENVYNALKYLSKKKSYNLNLIYESALRKYGWQINDSDMKVVRTVDSKEFLSYSQKRNAKGLRELKEFSNIWKNEEIYIYGAGGVGVKIYFLLRNDIEKFGGFIVSKIGNQQSLFGFPVLEYENISLKNKCIIVGLNPENSDEIRGKIKKTDRVMYIWEMLI